MTDLKNELTQNAYPGRGILLGRSADGGFAAIAYFIMGRSENSRNRIFEPDEMCIRDRMAAPGYAFSPDTEWQKDFEQRFPYIETEDQLHCTEEIKADMESPHPMDRVLCGDVGFGKTEVAMRACFKAVMDGKQCAILCPTTVSYTHLHSSEPAS